MREAVCTRCPLILDFSAGRHRHLDLLSPPWLSASSCSVSWYCLFSPVMQASVLVDTHHHNTLKLNANTTCSYEEPMNIQGFVFCSFPQRGPRCEGRYRTVYCRAWTFYPESLPEEGNEGRAEPWLRGESVKVDLFKVDLWSILTNHHSHKCLCHTVQ